MYNRTTERQRRKSHSEYQNLTNGSRRKKQKHRWQIRHHEYERDDAHLSTPLFPIANWFR